MTAPAPYLTPAEAATRLRVSLPTVYKLIRSRRIPVLHVGGQFRIAQRDLETALRDAQPTPRGISFRWDQ